MECEKCSGIGFIEYEHGLIRLGCEDCKGTGKLPDALTIENLEKGLASMKKEALPEGIGSKTKYVFPGNEPLKYGATYSILDNEETEEVNLPAISEGVINADKPKYLMVGTNTGQGMGAVEMEGKARAILKHQEELLDGNSPTGTGRTDIITGSGDTGKPRSTRKSKARAKSGKRSS